MVTVGRTLRPTPSPTHLSRSEMAAVYNAILGERLPGATLQEIDEESETQRYAIGARRQVGLTTYHYAKMLAGNSIGVGQQHRGVVNSLAVHTQNTAVAAAVGTNRLSIIDAAAVAHEYQNGKIVVWTAEWQVFDIVDNEASDGANTVLHLRTPVRNLIAAGTFTTLYPNPYSAVRAPSGDGYETFAGVPQRYVTDGYYFWLPTYGYANVTPAAEFGGAIQERLAVFDVADGTAEFIDTDYAAGNIHRQLLGWLVPHTGAGAGDTMFWLILDP